MGEGKPDKSGDRRRHKPAPLGRCLLRHRRTEQVLMVPFHTYIRQSRGRFCNWQLAADTIHVRPPITMSEFVLEGGDVK